MKEARILLSIDKHTQVYRDHVTPPEALLLTTMHHTALGDVPVVVDKATIKDLGKVDIDKELNRLRSIYHPLKIKALLSEVRDIPTDDFDAAIAKGMGTTLPSDALSSAASSVKGI